MTADSADLSGTGPAPLAATRRYTFNRARVDGGETRLTIPIAYRGSWDDYGIVERLEQDEFLSRFLKALNTPVRTGYPGEWFVTSDAAWDALRGVLREPVSIAPVATARRGVPDIGSLTPHYFDLVSVVAGLSGEGFVSRGPADSGELWRRGDVLVRVDPDAMRIIGQLGDDRDVAVTIVDGIASVTVRGVLDAQALADQFVAI